MGKKLRASCSDYAYLLSTLIPENPDPHLWHFTLPVTLAKTWRSFGEATVADLI